MSVSGVWNTTKSGPSNLKVVLALTCSPNCSPSELNSEVLAVADLVNIQFLWKVICNNEDVQEITFKYSISRCDINNDNVIKTNIESEELNFAHMGVDTPKTWAQWMPMGSLKQTTDRKNRQLCVLIEILITAYEVKVDVMASILFFDTEFTDFHLSTEQGSVAVHKACLAGHSDVFKVMLRGEWKETTEGQINIKGANLQTLKQLKAYMYLGTIPDNNDASLRPLLLVARCYLMKDLEKHCIRKLAEAVTPENLFSLTDFACENQIPELPLTLMQLTKDSVIKEAHLIKNKVKNEDKNRVNKSTK